VERAIDTQKKDKAPGPDGISNEILLSTRDIISPILANIFNNIFSTEVVPTQWTISNIILLFKKGDKNDISNYRPISLMSNIYKTFSKIILHRITTVLDENQPKEQAGFRSDYSVLDHIQTLKQIIEKYKEYGMPLYCSFVDYSKAFDSLDHNSIWEALKEQGVEHNFIRIIKNIYTNSKARIQLESKGNEIKIMRGVRQGDPLSPKLFSAVLEHIFRNVCFENCGIVLDGARLSHLRFADDLVILSNNPDQLQGMLQQISDESNKVGLQMNTEKTKVMTNRQRVPIKVDQGIIEYVGEYVYLGQIISASDIMDKEVDRRIANAWKRYWGLKEVMKNKNLSMAPKRKLFDTCILPVLTYGCQTWALTKKQLSKLTVCQHSMERSMMGVKRKDKKRLDDIRKQTRIEDITVKIRKLKWKWTGHMMRG
jgi:hypothetical protein